MDKLRKFEIQPSLDEKCWKLSSYILSQYDFEKLSHPHQEYWCIFLEKFNPSFETHFFRELVELSGLIRALLDSESIQVENQIYETDNSVGNLKKEETESKLYYREACNKIIHANNYKIKFIFSREHPLDNKKNGYNNSKIKRFKNPIIITEGIQNQRTWTAEINFLKFIDQTLNLPDPNG